MTMLREIKELWADLENKKDGPKYVSKVNKLDFKDLKQAIDEQNTEFIKKIIRKMYAGEAFILRNAAKKSLKEVIVNLAKKYDEKQKSSFYKMHDGCPNFHRIIDQEITKKYSLYAIKHSYYFYNWNIRTKLEKEFKDGVYRHWRYIKYLAGNSKYRFEKNIPSQKQIDRLQIVNYPHGGGELRDHEDPRKNQRIVSGLIMSKIGIDFKKGGFYFRSREGKKIIIEDQLEVGDSVMFYGSVIHGVAPVDKENKLDWKSYKGRWFVGMFVNDSDHLTNRITAKDLSASISNKTT